VRLCCLNFENDYPYIRTRKDAQGEHEASIWVLRQRATAVCLFMPLPKTICQVSGSFSGFVVIPTTDSHFPDSTTRRTRSHTTDAAGPAVMLLRTTEWSKGFRQSPGPGSCGGRASCGGPGGHVVR